MPFSGGLLQNKPDNYIETRHHCWLAALALQIRTSLLPNQVNDVPYPSYFAVHYLT